MEDSDGSTRVLLCACVCYPLSHPLFISATNTSAAAIPMVLFLLRTEVLTVFFSANISPFLHSLVSHASWPEVVHHAAVCLDRRELVPANYWCFCVVSVFAARSYCTNILDSLMLIGGFHLPSETLGYLTVYECGIWAKKLADLSTFRSIFEHMVSYMCYRIW